MMFSLKVPFHTKKFMDFSQKVYGFLKKKIKNKQNIDTRSYFKKLMPNLAFS